MNKSRLEAFSDGVLAIIITIMVLELRPPEGEGWTALLRAWPHLVGYAVSFVYIGIYWTNHHHVMQAVRRVSGAVLWANLHLLFWLSLFPFVTEWVGESHFGAVAMTCYAGVALLAAVAYTILVRVMIRADDRNHLLAEVASGGGDLKGNLSIVAYVVGVVAPFLGRGGTAVTGAMLALVALMWLVPDRGIERVLALGGERE
ncbi:TMEM175 family protein [Deinococcus pimensis]|uniref:TMEM175 family protein n=1 Tax=Deinococcus pimensis TaxID=309888 RepID=UPI000488298C|nr:TMEM175 family protein [Deinococcus pimensis]